MAQMRSPYYLGMDSRRFKPCNSNINLQRSLLIIDSSGNREEDSACVLGLSASSSFGVRYTRSNMRKRGCGKQGSPVQLVLGWSALIKSAATDKTVHFSTFSAASDNTITENGSLFNEKNELPVMIIDSPTQGLNQVTRLSQALHDSASSILSALEQHGSLTNGPWFAKAWIGVDMNAWLKYFSYQAAVCALFQAVLEIGAQGQDKSRDAYVSVQKILLPQISCLEEMIRCRLSSKDPNADKWFWSEQFPVAVTRFTDIVICDAWLKDFTSRNQEQRDLGPGKSGDIALIILAISSCTAVMKLSPGKISCPELLASLPEEMGRLMSLLATFISMEQMYLFTSQVGLEQEFLKYFGSKVANHSENQCGITRDRAFWVDLIQSMLKVAVQREGVILKLACGGNTKVMEGDLAVFGFFAVLGRKMRYFLSSNDITILGGPLKKFFSYLEGGSVLIYPQLTSLTLYQLFIEVATEELEWLQFYPAVPDSMHQSKRNLKKPISKVEKEMILSATFGVCSDWLGSFIYYSKWIQQPAGMKAAKFVFDSQTQLNMCLEECWMATANDKSSGQGKSKEIKITNDFDSMADQEKSSAMTTYERKDAGRRLVELDTLEVTEACTTQLYKIIKSTVPAGTGLVKLEGLISDAEAEPVRQDIFNKSIEKIKTASSDVWMGTQLLAADVAVAVDLLQKNIAGLKLTNRERKKLKQTLTDLASVIPIGILMLIPVTAVGHAAMLAAIQKYIPSLIPSAYSASRLDLLKQLNQVRQMEVKSTSTTEQLASSETIVEATRN